MDTIISRQHIRNKARNAYARGIGRDEHGFNWHAKGAIAEWQSEWDRCAAEHAPAANEPQAQAA